MTKPAITPFNPLARAPKPAPAASIEYEENDLAEDVAGKLADFQMGDIGDRDRAAAGADRLFVDREILVANVCSDVSDGLKHVAHCNLREKIKI
jgi:hypothetical protein